MAHYIDKDALVAEINQRIEDYKAHKIDDSYHYGLIFALEDLRDDFIDTLEVKEVQEEPVSEDLEEACNNFCVNARKGYPRVMDKTDRYICNAFKASAKWQKEHLWKSADGEDLPEYDRDVIVLT